MSSFSSYAFNKAHACAYAFVAYRTAYLKCHFKAEYFASLMTGVLDNTTKITHYTAQCKKIGFIRRSMNDIMIFQQMFQKYGVDNIAQIGFAVRIIKSDFFVHDEKNRLQIVYFAEQQQF